MGARPGPRMNPDPTEFQLQCLRLAAEGLTDTEIKIRLGRSANAVKMALRGAYRKLNARNRTHAVVLAWRHGYLTLEPPEDPRDDA